MLALSFAGYVIGKYYAFMPWSLDAALVSLIFIGVGNWMRKESFFEKSYCYTFIIVSYWSSCPLAEQYYLCEK